MNASLAVLASSVVVLAQAKPPELTQEPMLEREIPYLREIRLSSTGRIGVCAMAYLSIEDADGTQHAAVEELLSLVRNPIDLDFSPDGNMVAVAGMRGPVAVQELEPSRLVVTIDAEKVSSVWFGPNGKSVIVGHDGDDFVAIVQYDLETGERLREYGEKVQHAFASAAGGTLATVLEDRSVLVWDVRTGEQLMRVAEKRAFDLFSGCALSPDGSRLALASSEGVTVWEVSSGKKLMTRWKKEGRFPELAFGSTGEEVYAVCLAKKGRKLPPISLRVLRIDDGSELARSELEEEPKRLVTCDDGSLVDIRQDLLEKRPKVARWRLVEQER